MLSKGLSVVATLSWRCNPAISVGVQPTSATACVRGPGDLWPVFTVSESRDFFLEPRIACVGTTAVRSGVVSGVLLPFFGPARPTALGWLLAVCLWVAFSVPAPLTFDRIPFSWPEYCHSVGYPTSIGGLSWHGLCAWSVRVEGSPVVRRVPRHIASSGQPRLEGGHN